MIISSGDSARSSVECFELDGSIKKDGSVELPSARMSAVLIQCTGGQDGPKNKPSEGSE
jgi:hypothetical protein